MSESTSITVFDSLLADVTVSVKPILAIKVTGPESAADAQKAGGQLAFLLKKLEAAKAEVMAPIRAQEQAINDAYKRVKAVLDGPGAHIKGQINAYADEVARKRNEDLRAQREKEELARRFAEAQRREAEAKRMAEQEAERREREAAAEAERFRIAKEAAARVSAAALFGADEAETAKVRAEEEAALDKQKMDAEAAEKVLAEHQERERIAEQARLAREEAERAKAAEAERKAIEAQRVKGTRTELVITVVDIWAVPREYLRDPELKVNDVKKDYKAGLTKIPGLQFSEEARVAMKSEPLPTALKEA